MPRLGGKRDVIPNRTNEIWFTPDSAGVYDGQCAEFCGVQHANMRFIVVAEAAQGENCLLGAATEKGVTVRDAAELRVKETDRIRTVVDNLHRMGVAAEELPDGMVVPGRQRAPLRSRQLGIKRIAFLFARVDDDRGLPRARTGQGHRRPPAGTCRERGRFRCGG